MTWRTIVIVLALAGCRGEKKAVAQAAPEDAGDAQRPQLGSWTDAGAPDEPRQPVLGTWPSDAAP